MFLDAAERRYIEELGGMNVFFVFADGTLVTPPLSDSILPGITRDSVITLAREAGLTVKEEPYTIDAWRADVREGRLTEAFACGTAAVITPIGTVKGREESLHHRDRQGRARWRSGCGACWSTSSGATRTMPMAGSRRCSRVFRRSASAEAGGAPPRPQSRLIARRRLPLGGGG